MTCLISIAGGIAYRQSNQTQIDQFSVFGVALDCPEVAVTLSVGTPAQTETATVAVGPTGAWSAQLDMSQYGLSCADASTSIDVSVVCTSDPGCTAATKFDNVTCQTIDACPAFEKVGAVALSDAENGCNIDGERRVDLRATLMSAVPSGLPVVAQFCLQNLETGEETFLNAEVLTPQVPFTGTAHLPGGVYLYQLHVISPQPCPGPLGVLDVAACPVTDTGTVCPLVIIGDKTISDKCTPEGRRIVDLSATITPEPGYPADVVLKVMQGDTDIAEIDTVLGATTQTTLSGSRHLVPGDYRVIADVTGPSACNGNGADFTVPPCVFGGPPDLEEPDGTPDNDIPGNDTPGGEDTISTDEDTTRPPPDRTPPPRGGINWCLILFWTGFALFLTGAVAVGVGYCAIGLGVHPIWVGIWALIINVGMVMLIIGTLLLTVWIFLCGSCAINCDALKWFRDVLIVLDVVFAALVALGGVIIALSPLCFVGWIIDVGFTSYLLLLAHFWVFFSGCEEYSDWWPDALQFTMPDSLRAHCGRDG